MEKPTLKKFRARPFAGVLLAITVIGFVILYLGAFAALPVQTISLLVSMVLIFYSSHPLAHYLVGWAYGVSTKYFFLGRSDFRKLGGALGRATGNIPTVGTRFDLAQAASIDKTRRAFLFGSGAIVSSMAMLIPIILAIIFVFDTIALVVGTLLFLATLATEIIFSTKIGDLAKMKRELSSV